VREIVRFEKSPQPVASCRRIDEITNFVFRCENCICGVIPLTAVFFGFVAPIFSIFSERIHHSVIKINPPFARFGFATFGNISPLFVECVMLVDEDSSLVKINRFPRQRT
jgi:hypothetical protein